MSRLNWDRARERELLKVQVPVAAAGRHWCVGCGKRRVTAAGLRCSSCRSRRRRSR